MNDGQIKDMTLGKIRWVILVWLLLAALAPAALGQNRSARVTVERLEYWGAQVYAHVVDQAFRRLTYAVAVEGNRSYNVDALTRSVGHLVDIVTTETDAVNVPDQISPAAPAGRIGAGRPPFRVWGTIVRVDPVIPPSDMPDQNLVLEINGPCVELYTEITGDRLSTICEAWPVSAEIVGTEIRVVATDGMAYAYDFQGRLLRRAMDLESLEKTSE